MSFFSVSKSKEDVQQNSGSAHISKSGVYPVNIIAPFVSVSKNGATTVDLFLEHADKKQVMYGNMRITNNDGGRNEIGSRVLNQLVIIADVEDVSDPIDAELPIGKGGIDKDVCVLEDLTDVDVILRVQLEYSVWDGSIMEKKVIKGFYRSEDNASAEEIVNETEAGVQFEKDSKYFDNISYKDSLDEDAITEWVKKDRPKGSVSGSSGAKVKKTSFGKKTFNK